MSRPGFRASTSADHPELQRNSIQNALIDAGVVYTPRNILVVEQRPIASPEVAIRRQLRDVSTLIFTKVPHDLREVANCLKSIRRPALRL